MGQTPELLDEELAANNRISIEKWLLGIVLLGLFTILMVYYRGYDLHLGISACIAWMTAFHLRQLKQQTSLGNNYLHGVGIIGAWALLLGIILQLLPYFFAITLQEGGLFLLIGYYGLYHSMPTQYNVPNKLLGSFAYWSIGSFCLYAWLFMQMAPIANLFLLLSVGLALVALSSLGLQYEQIKRQQMSLLFTSPMLLIIILAFLWWMFEPQTALPSPNIDFQF